MAPRCTMFFPTKYCGLWTLLSSTNYNYRQGSQLKIDYNRIQFSPLEKWGPLRITKNIYGSVLVKNDNFIKVNWVDTAELEIETFFFPTVQIPIKNKCPPMVVCHCMDDLNKLITLRDSKHEYIFRVNPFPTEKKESILKLFLLQLVFDYLIRHLY
jgi:hypothetical protein